MKSEATHPATIKCISGWFSFNSLVHSMLDPSNAISRKSSSSSTCLSSMEFSHPPPTGEAIRSRRRARGEGRRRELQRRSCVGERKVRRRRPEEPEWEKLPEERKATSSGSQERALLSSSTTLPLADECGNLWEGTSFQKSLLSSQLSSFEMGASCDGDFF